MRITVRKVIPHFLSTYPTTRTFIESNFRLFIFYKINIHQRFKTNIIRGEYYPIILFRRIIFTRSKKKKKHITAFKLTTNYRRILTNEYCTVPPVNIVPVIYYLLSLVIYTQSPERLSMNIQ